MPLVVWLWRWWSRFINKLFFRVVKCYLNLLTVFGQVCRQHPEELRHWSLNNSRQVSCSCHMNLSLSRFFWCSRAQSLRTWFKHHTIIDHRQYLHLTWHTAVSTLCEVHCGFLAINTKFGAMQCILVSVFGFCHQFDFPSWMYGGDYRTLHIYDRLIYWNV